MAFGLCRYRLVLKRADLFKANTLGISKRSRSRQYEGKASQKDKSRKAAHENPIADGSVLVTGFLEAMQQVPESTATAGGGGLTRGSRSIERDEVGRRRWPLAIAALVRGTCLHLHSFGLLGDGVMAKTKSYMIDNTL